MKDSKEYEKNNLSVAISSFLAVIPCILMKAADLHVLPGSLPVTSLIVYGITVIIKMYDF